MHFGKNHVHKNIIIYKVLFIMNILRQTYSYYFSEINSMIVGVPCDDKPETMPLLLYRGL